MQQGREGQRVLTGTRCPTSTRTLHGRRAEYVARCARSYTVVNFPSFRLCAYIYTDNVYYRVNHNSRRGDMPRSSPRCGKHVRIRVRRVAGVSEGARRSAGN